MQKERSSESGPGLGDMQAQSKPIEAEETRVLPREGDGFANSLTLDFYLQNHKRMGFYCCKLPGIWPFVKQP